MFQSTLPTRGSDLRNCLAIPLSFGFNPRSPRGGATMLMSLFWYMVLYSFNPRSPRGGATILGMNLSSTHIGFQSTLPTRGSDVSLVIPILVLLPFQSTLPTRGSDFCLHSPHSIQSAVSIHAPHEGERHYFAVDDYYVQFVSIHAPHEGERPSAAFILDTIKMFQSTLPTRGSDA